MKVLFVEDYVLAAELVRHSLRRRAPEIELDIVGTVAQALAKLDAPRYDIVLTDLHLPDGLGTDIAAHVRSTGLPLPVVILTGAEGDETVRAARDAGATACVAKRDDYLVDLPRTLRAALASFTGLTQG